MHRLMSMSLLLLVSLSLSATPGHEAYVPDELKAWVPWVLQDKQAQRCTPDYAGERRLCSWPGALSLELDDQEGRFQQAFRLEAPNWVSLPGDKTHWPQDVLVDGTPAPVTQRDGRPAIYFSPPATPADRLHTLSGRFVWHKLPDALSLPSSTALISATLNGEPLPGRMLDNENRLWLRGSNQALAKEDKPRSTSVQVFRKFTDGVPMTMETRLVLDISQQSGELIAGPVLLPGFVAHGIDSPLPARIDAEQRLRLQARPGRWTIRILARHPEPTNNLTVPAGLAQPWPQEETWVFQPMPDLRLVEPSGLAPLDPRQTRTPREWKQLSTFRAVPEESLTLRVERRGDPHTEADRLSLQRDMWLDFSGAGYSVRDQITGTLARSWRLRTEDALQLGQVSINGQPQLITTRGDEHEQGFEVRHGQLKLTADGLIPGDPRQPSANGWLLDFQHTITRLHLPPGWTLLAAMGMDNTPDSWIQRWSLMDLFLVLLIVIGGIKVWGWGMGLLFLPALVLTWQAHEAPQYVWLSVLVASVLRQAVATEIHPKLSRSIAIFLYISLIALVLVVLPHLIHQVKTGLFPQLERPWQALTQQPMAEAAAPAEMDMEMPMIQAPRNMQAVKPLRKKALGLSSYSNYAPTKQKAIQRVDPNAKVQTGPGVPDWHWNQVEFNWNGPVSQGEQLQLMLLPPLASGAIKLIGALLIALLTALLTAILLKRELHNYRSRSNKKATAAAIWLIPLALLGSSSAHSAAFPPESLLQQLEQRLMAPEKCFPQCANIARMALQAGDDDIRILLEVDVQQASAIPIPSAKERWRITRAIIDGNEDQQVLRREGEHLWLPVPKGRHRIFLSGPVDGNAPITLHLPLLPRSAQVSLSSAWSIQGVDDNGQPASQIQLIRAALTEDNDPKSFESTQLLPYLSMQRTLLLGLDWRIQNRLIRLSATDNPIVIKIPLVAGESVLSESVKTDEGFALVNLRPGQKEITWDSSLDPVDQLHLSATTDTFLHETWRLDASTLWHVEATGIPPVHNQGKKGRWLPAWRPWPGETLDLRIDRPQSIKGQTLTIDRAELKTRPGKRLSESTLELSIRAAQGGQHGIRLPEGAKLQQVKIDRKVYPARLEGSLLTLPIRPGALEAKIEWRGADPMRERFSTPSVALNSPAVNAATHVSVGQDRWILWVSGSGIGPAVQFWGMLIVILIGAILLGRIKTTPLRTLDWFLLGIGLSQIDTFGALLPVIWLFALGARQSLSATIKPFSFNFLQLALAFLSIIAISALFEAVRQGLLGLPSMNIGGNGSNDHELSWYMDRITDGVMPSAHIYSVPMLAYRLLMLAWALWLAFKLVNWVKWGWQAYASPALWRKVDINWTGWKRQKTKTTDGATPAKDIKI